MTLRWKVRTERNLASSVSQKALVSSVTFCSLPTAFCACFMHPEAFSTRSQAFRTSTEFCFLPARTMELWQFWFSSR